MKNRIPDVHTAHLANELAIDARIDFKNAREWNLFLLLVSQLDPQNQDELDTAIMSISDLIKIFETPSKKTGNLYRYLRDCSESMAKATCRFDTDVVMDGVMLPKIRTIFSMINPYKTENGTAFIEYRFNDLMKPLLLGFKKNFMGINPPVWIKSGHAIRFLILAKAERDRRRAIEDVTHVKYKVEELKRLLGIEGKYPEFKEFKRRVIKPILEGIETIDYLKVTKYRQHRTGRAITHVSFYIEDGTSTMSKKKHVPALSEEKKEDKTSPSVAEIRKLSYSKTKAYEFLAAKGIYPGIAYSRIIPKIPSSECYGYEDYFCEEAYKIVLEKSNAKTNVERAGVFVTWFKGDIFRNDQFSRIIETVVARKKALNNEKRANREEARNMTYDEFVEAYRKRSGEIRTKEHTIFQPDKSIRDTEAIGDIVQNLRKGMG